MAHMLAYVRRWAMGAIMIIITIEGQRARLQNEVEPRDDEARCGATGRAASAMTKCGEYLQMSVALAIVPIS